MQIVISHYSLASTDAFRPEKWIAPSYASRSRTEPLTALEKTKAFRIASAFKSENLFFVVIIQPSNVKSCRLSIPVNFARKYLTKMHKEVIHLLSNGKSWPVIYFQHSIEKPSLISGTGWRGFAMDNNLEVDDVCAFELIEGPKTSMKVTIYKMQAVEDSSLGK
ncbi:B3 domain-containing protein Os11g0197600-like [Gossypium hirsutum]|uniref:B3 domain-containing protein Os11g0197600-like n=1 Tax=Gossypium hirsutum TaxID=3635 RepID=A0ABM2ZRX9_GOSHI|nr:B3 domain-containing protein Os11g0197600-like [Gossypium hirsutum]